MSHPIEVCIDQEDWEAARHLILQELYNQPEDHWLLTRLALIYYEQRDYERALQLSEEAFALAPECPLVLWDYAGALEMLERPQEAQALYQRIIERGIESLTSDPCSEGRARARGLYADSLYRLSHCYRVLGDKSNAMQMLRQHLQQRGPGCQSIYPIQQVRKELHALEV